MTHEEKCGWGFREGFSEEREIEGERRENERKDLLQMPDLSCLDVITWSAAGWNQFRIRSC